MSDSAAEPWAAVADGVLEYLKRYERRVAAGTGAGSAGGVARQ